jgi:hypothetical protein
MDGITKKQVIIDMIIDFLREGNYVAYTDKYTGSYYDGISSKDRFKIKKRNIIFVNHPYIYTTSGKTLELKQLAISAKILGKYEYIPVYVAIDTDDWKIYMNWRFNYE